MYTHTHTQAHTHTYTQHTHIYTHTDTHTRAPQGMHARNVQAILFKQDQKQNNPWKEKNVFEEETS